MVNKSQHSYERPLSLIKERVNLVNSVSDFWEADEAQIWWHPGLGVFSSSRDLSSFWGLTNTSGRILRTIRLMKGALEFGTSSVGPFEIGIKLPSDAVIIGSHRPRGPVIVSASQARVLKWVSRQPHLANKFQNEINALKIGGRIEGGVNFPTLHSYGNHDEDADWMLTNYIPNPRPFYSLHRNLVWHKIWLPWVASHGLPFLWKFYHAAGCEVSSTANVLYNLLPDDSYKYRNINLFLRLKEMTDRLGHLPIVRSFIHGDFSGNHIHRNHSNFKVIDWGESRLDFSFKDVLTPYWDHPGGSKPGTRDFWTWLSGANSETPAVIKMYLSSQERELDISMSPELFRDQLQLILLHDVASRIVSINIKNESPLMLPSSHKAMLTILNV